MRLKDLIECDIVKDNHKIIISQRVIGAVRTVARVNWYQDHALDFLDREIYSASFKAIEEGRWYIELLDMREDSNVSVQN